MADIGELTDKRKLIVKKKLDVELLRLHIKRDEFGIRKIEAEEELEIIERKIEEIEKQIKEKQTEIRNKQ